MRRRLSYCVCHFATNSSSLTFKDIVCKIMILLNLSFPFVLKSFPDSCQVLPISICSSLYHSGYQTRKREGKKFCCYNCVPCPEGKISNSRSKCQLATYL
uniref:GPCR family 3 nine cysteines domain-containing protein n=1 Tax=Salvator merianae TaxID=96440 RepID=A0A8D0C4V1_SALMN